MGMICRIYESVIVLFISLNHGPLPDTGYFMYIRKRGIPLTVFNDRLFLK